LRTLHRYILGEISTYFLLCVFLLTFLLLLNRMFQLTDLVINKGVPLSIVGKLLLTIVPVLLLVTLPMSILVACILGFSRLSNDSEFVAMTSSGMSLYSQLIPVALLGAFAAALSTVLMIFGLPWSHQMTNSLRFEILQSQAAVFEIREQVFNDSFDGLVIYVRKAAPRNGALQGILISDSRNPKNSQVIFAERGLVVRDPEKKNMFLRLSSGSIHKVASASNENFEKGPRQKGTLPSSLTSLQDNQYQVVKFGTYDLNLNLTRTISEGKALRVRLRALPISELRQKISKQKPGTVKYNSMMVEFHQRFATPFACLALALLGAPLGVQNRRSGRHGGFALSLVVIFAYYILSSFTEGMGENGRIPAFLSAWGPNVLLFFVALWAIRKVVRRGTVDIFGYFLRALSRFPLPDWIQPKTA
jgi:lipopolysaccharide export system permease protein